MGTLLWPKSQPIAVDAMNTVSFGALLSGIFTYQPVYGRFLFTTYEVEFE